MTDNQVDEALAYMKTEMQKVIIDLMHMHALWDDANVYPMYQALKKYRAHKCEVPLDPSPPYYYLMGD